MRNVRYLLAAVVLMLPAVVSAGLSPTIRVVPTDFPTIQGAVDAANPGDTILIRAGLYDENVSIDTDNLTVLGRCQAKNMPLEFQGDPTQMTLVDGGTNGNVFDISASNVRLACLTTRHGFTGINVSQFGIPPGGSSLSGFSMSRVTVLRPQEFGVYIEALDYAIDQSRVIGSSWEGISVSFANSGSVTNTSVRGADGDCFYFGWSDSTRFDNNVAHGCNGYGAQLYGDNLVFSNNELRSNQGGAYLDGANMDVRDNSIFDSCNFDDGLFVIGDDMVVQNNAVGGCFYDNYSMFGDRAQISGNVGTASTDDYCFDLGGNAMNFSNNFCGAGNYFGVFFSGTNSVFSQNTVDGALFDPFYITGDNNEISGNSVARAYDGIEVYGNDVLVSGNDVTETTFDALFVYGDNQPRVIDNVVSMGGSTMIQVYCNITCFNSEVTGNQVLRGGSGGFAFRGFGGGAQSGLFVNSRFGMDISGNTVENSRGYGFELYCDDCLVTFNTARYNGSSDGFRAGFYIGGTDSTFMDNVATGNTGPGFKIGGSNHTIRFNTSMLNLLEGYKVIGFATGNVIDQNVAERNHGEGFDNQGLLTTLSNNRSEFNRGDCVNGGTGATVGFNLCGDGANFTSPGQLD